jgi:TPR repeat protein
MGLTARRATVARAGRLTALGLLYYKLMPDPNLLKDLKFAARKYIAGPLYIPASESTSLGKLASEGPAGFIAEVNRLAANGSAWALATIGYLSCMPDKNGKRNWSKAIEVCEAPAAAGDPFAQFILAWALRYSNRCQEALRNMKASAAGGFSPAMMGLSTFLMAGVGIQQQDTRGAFQALIQAKRAGHNLAAVRYNALCRVGHCGILRQFGAFLLAPAVFFRSGLAGWRDPFSANSFILNAQNKKYIRVFRRSR